MIPQFYIAHFYYAEFYEWSARAMRETRDQRELINKMAAFFYTA